METKVFSGLKMSPRVRSASFHYSSANEILCIPKGNGNKDSHILGVGVPRKTGLYLLDSALGPLIP